ncbi:MAG: PIN domain-containing protein [Chloroflexota bacterium]|nr:PIN domain-containing protein [Chloroflexota bacterium]
MPPGVDALAGVDEVAQVFDDSRAAFNRCSQEPVLRSARSPQGYSPPPAEPGHDPDHRRCVEAAGHFTELVVPALVLVEVDYWCRRRGGGPEAFARLAADLAAGAYRLESLDEADLVRAADLEVTYGDLDLGLVDASVIATCERLGQEAVLTLDRRDFSVVRPRHCAALRLLP